eukprot:GHVR01091111.1.p1 GENE.GHVR01091111.1~~GHVR01091111.1.p1  ORF type:complete len:140 (-),score=45.40 GHVR01091111.1:432-851(-)
MVDVFNIDPVEFNEADSNQQQRLLEKQRLEEEEHNKIREIAKKERDLLYEERRLLIESNAKANRLIEANSREAKVKIIDNNTGNEKKIENNNNNMNIVEKSCDWNDVVSLIDFSKERHYRDTTRMKNILLDLKNKEIIE